MYENQNPGWLLLLCLWITRKPTSACLQLRYDGPWHDRSHQVRLEYIMNTAWKLHVVLSLLWDSRESGFLQITQGTFFLSTLKKFSKASYESRWKTNWACKISNKNLLWKNHLNVTFNFFHPKKPKILFWLTGSKVPKKGFVCHALGLLKAWNAQQSGRMRNCQASVHPKLSRFQGCSWNYAYQCRHANRRSHR